MAKSAEDNLAI